MHLRVYVRTETILALLARKNWEQADLAKSMSVSATYVSLIIKRRARPSPEMRQRLMATFRGMSHKPGGRLTWDDMFTSELVGSGAAL